MSDLLPCPFCGGTNIGLLRHFSYYPHGVMCRHCYASATSIERWNNRAIPAVKPKVKPLVWCGEPADFYMFADTAFGLYEIGVEHGDEWFSDFTDHKSGKPVRLSSWQDGSIAPQAAAQADYEARILSTLEPAVQPDAAAIREAALREAASVVAQIESKHRAAFKYDFDKSAGDKSEGADECLTALLALINNPRKETSHE